MILCLIMGVMSTSYISIYVQPKVDIYNSVKFSVYMSVLDNFTVWKQTLAPD